MSAKGLVRRPLTMGILIVMLFAALVGQRSASAAGIEGVAPGTTVPAGTNAVTEVVDRGANTITIFGGSTPADFVTGQDMNAWSGYSSANLAAKGACDEAQGRHSDSNYSTFAVTVNGASFTDHDACIKALSDAAAANSTPATGSSAADCSSPVSSTGDTVQESEEAVCVKSGEWVVVRVTKSNSGTIAITVKQLDKDTSYPGIKGQTATHVWWNYGSPAMAYIAGCNEARVWYSTAYGTDASQWDWGYVVTLNKGDVPVDGSCKQWAADQLKK